MALTKTEEDLLRRMLTKDIDLKGRRIINAGASEASGDYVTKAELDALVARVKELENEVL